MTETSPDHHHRHHHHDHHHDPQRRTPMTTRRRRRGDPIKWIFLFSIFLSVGVSLWFLIFSSSISITTITTSQGGSIRPHERQEEAVLPHHHLLPRIIHGSNQERIDAAASSNSTTTRANTIPSSSLSSSINVNVGKSTGSSGHKQQRQQQQRQPRILLGIFTILDVPAERQRRHLIRNTYLDFDRVHNNTTSHRSCSLNEFMGRQQQHDYRDCQLVYTFLCSPGGGNTTTTNNNNSNNNNNDTSSSLVMDPSLFPDYIHETDLLFLKTPNYHNNADDPTKDGDANNNNNNSNNVQQRVEMIFQWYRYYHQHQSTTIHSSMMATMDYVAFTDTQVVIFPSKFWKNDLFYDGGDIMTAAATTTTSSSGAGRDGSSSSSRSRSSVYAGISVPQSECVDKKCPSLRGDVVMRRFVLVSTDLVDYMVQATEDDTATTTTTSTSPKVTSLPLLQLQPKEAPEVAVANLVHHYSQQQQQQHSSSSSSSVQNISLSGLVSKTSQRGLVGDYLQVWDRYKDSLTHYDADEQTSAFPRILLGIFTMDSPTEIQRRDVIRKTYLRYYYFRGRKGQKTKTPHRICSLQEYRAELDPKQQKDDDGGDGGDDEKDDDSSSSYTYYCQMVYTFVMGSNPNGPKELVEDSHASLPLTVANPPVHLANETDILHLNIQENMKEGKSQTWLKYATWISKNSTLPLDYVGKIDGDTLLYPHLFLKEVLQGLPHSRTKKPYNIRVYGGDYRIRPSTATLNLGPVYMGGHFYFLSLDLAQYIVGDQCNRTAVAVYSEDQSIGNFVHTHPLPIRRIRLTTRLFEHPLKRIDRMRTLWRKQIGQKAPQQQQHQNNKPKK
jgi:hypothetical protein